MPKKAFDYGKTEIYKIIHVDPDIDLSYVGHTTNFVQREKNHKYNCEHYGKYYTYANDNNVYGVIRNKEVTEKWASYMALRGGVIQHVSTPAPADDYQDLGTVLAALKKIYADQFQKYSIMYILKP